MAEDQHDLTPIKIQKSEITFTCLHPAADTMMDWSIERILHECDNGGFVGMWTRTMTHDLADAKVVSELLALGNDGTFFADILGDGA